MNSTSPPEGDPDAVRPTGPAAPMSGCSAAPARHRWVPFVLPLVVFLVVTSFEPAPPAEAIDPQADQTAARQAWFGISIPYCAYPFVYTAKVVLTIAALAFAWPAYRQFPFRLSPLALVVGVVGAGLWVGLCSLQVERRVVTTLGLDGVLGWGERSGFNPLVEMASHPAAAYGFLAIRLVGLALIVPLIEEFFLRGFVMRYCLSERWWTVPFGTVNRLALIVGTALPMAMHPAAELLASGVWFSLVTGLMIRTRNIWDCVAAHAVTNLLLGVYVVAADRWQLL